MPLLDQITLSPADLKNIEDFLTKKGHSGSFKVIDTNGTLTIRDTDEQSIGTIARDTGEVWGGP